MKYNPKTALKIGSSNEKDLAKFATLSVDAQAQCIKAVARYLVMKGAMKTLIGYNKHFQISCQLQVVKRKQCREVESPMF
jgi:hypothetical protein